MKKKLAIRYMGMVIDRFALEPGEYSVGRSEENHILVQHISIERKQGKIYEDKGAWFYVDASTGKEQKITNDEAVNISSDIDLVTLKYVEKADTQTYDQSELITLRKSQQKWKALVAGLVLLLIFASSVGTYSIYKEFYKPMNANTLLEKVRPQIVEFEMIRDDRAIEDYKELASLKDKDFLNNYGFCTGFLVAPNIILTAAHCLLGKYVIDLNNNFVLKTHDGKVHKVDRVLGFDVKRDYLFLETKGLESYGYLDFVTTYKEGQKVFTVGNVHGQGVAIRDGIVSSETADLNDPDIKLVRYSAGASPGNSGGPLIDEKGRVVALVFASTYTENYNYGTSSKDLVAGFQRFVENQEVKDVEIDFKKITDFSPQLVMQSLSIPYMAHFGEYPELVEKYLSLKVTVQVPMAVQDLDENIIGTVNTQVVKNYEALREELSKKGEVVLDWKSFVSEKTPSILPSQFDHSQKYFVKGRDGKFYMKIGGFIDSPSKKEFFNYVESLEERRKFDFQSYGYNIEQQKKVYGGVNKADMYYLPKRTLGGKPRLLSLGQGIPYSQMWVFPGQGPDAERKGLDINVFIANFLGKEGVITNIVSPYVRPNSIRDFTITSISREPEVAIIKDSLGRNWRRSYFKLFESFHVATYCISRPQGDHCIGRIFDVLNPSLYKTIEDNFQKFVLSHLLLNPYFWSPDSIIAFQNSEQAKGLRSLAGVKLEERNRYLVSLEGFGLGFQIPKWGTQSIRLQTGLYHNSGKPMWTGYGAEWVSSKNGVDRLCGAGVEPQGSFSGWMLNYWRESRKRKKIDSNLKEEDIPKIRKRVTTSRDGKPMNFYSYCSPLIENPLSPGYYFADFKKSRPLAINPFRTVN